MKHKLEQLLNDNLSLSYLSVVDDSDAHLGHIGSSPTGETHFSVTIVSNDFAGKNHIERHRLVNTIAKDCFKHGLHALCIKTLTPEEHANT